MEPLARQEARSVAAAAILGHSGTGTIDVYLEQAVGRAAEVMARAG